MNIHTIVFVTAAVFWTLGAIMLGFVAGWLWRGRRKEIFVEDSSCGGRHCAATEGDNSFWTCE